MFNAKKKYDLVLAFVQTNLDISCQCQLRGVSAAMLKMPMQLVNWPIAPIECWPWQIG